jgi:hypothetical protein
MIPSEFIRTIYLGDRACKSITIDGWNATVRIQIDCISRVRSSAGTWDYYADEDINDGYLVLTGVQSCELDNQGYLPNDLMNDIEVRRESEEVAELVFSIGSVDAHAGYHETLLRIICKSIHLEDPARPGVPIHE